MYKWFLITLLVCIAASETKLFTFDPLATVLAECIEYHIVNIDGQFKSTRVANDTAHFAARRFHGKSMPTKIFNSRFKDFFRELRGNKVRNELREDQLSNQLRTVLKQAIMICGDDSSLPTADTTNGSKFISFNPDETLLSKCIETHLKLTGNPEFNQDNIFTEEIANLAARRHHGKSSSKKSFNLKNKNLFYNLRTNIIHHKMDVNKLTVELQSLVQQAIEDCATDKLPLTAVPTFAIEPIKTARVLDLILVKWPLDLRHMMQSQSGRLVLRKYASDAWVALLDELNVCQNNTQTFRLALRSFWDKRAQELYNAYSTELPYLVHRYTLNYPTPHMIQSDFKKFVNRRSIKFSDRNPSVPKSYLNEILDIHKSDNSHSESNFDIFDDYYNNGMTHAEYYLENQICQFYRVLFFFIELCARGICTDEKDDYDGPLPNDLVSEQVQAIMYDNYAYRNYLLNEKQFYIMFMGNDTQDAIAQSLFKNARVLEENLILLRSNIPSCSGVQYSTSTVRSTTQLLKRKDNVWKNENDKYFFKRAKTNNLYFQNLNEVVDSSVQKTVNSSITNLTDEDFTMQPVFYASLKQNENENHNIFGYVMLSDNNLNLLQFSDEDFLFF